MPSARPAKPSSGIGKTACMMLQESTALEREFRGRHLWARGHFRRGTGDVTGEVVAAYIAHRGGSGPGDLRLERGDF